jgi:hypothetical protein
LGINQTEENKLALYKGHVFIEVRIDVSNQLADPRYLKWSINDKGFLKRGILLEITL